MVSTAIDPSAVARVVGIKTDFVNLRTGITFLPRHVAMIGQGNSAATYSTDKRRITSAAEAGSVYGFGSPIHLAARQLLPANGDGLGTIPVTVFPLEDDGSGVAAEGDIAVTGSPTGSGAFRVIVNSIRSEQFVVTADDDLDDIATKMTDAINAVLEMPIIATANTTPTEEAAEFEAKWAGESGNDIFVRVEGPTDIGVTFAVTQASGGLVNPDISGALDSIGSTWYTELVNCLNFDDTDALDAFSTFGEGRWGPLVRKPANAFAGYTGTTVATAQAVTDDRTTDRTNVLVAAPGSEELPLAVAARAVARIARVANSNPPRDYGSQRLSGLVPGDESVQWTYTQRDQAVKAGISTTELRDGGIVLADIITMFRPEGDPTPAYRYVVDIVKLQNTIFNLDLEFVQAKWDGAPLIPDDQPTINPEAKRPKDAKAAVAGIIDSLALNAILSDPETAKESIQANIDTQNPKRLNVAFTAQISGNTNIVSVDFNFGFFFGQPQAA